MLSIQGIYDGKVLKVFDEIQINSPQKVIITFLENPIEDINAEELHIIAQQGGAFDFLNNEGEDIYTDNDLKVNY
ncbi:MAG: hypothetical protein DRJ05_02770 [Bacteroidetes bacterium]|nr:MAG: hypothetical protein DRJ05_02770 [Bacteroidota bacterium]